jgi:hypothetical protein
MKFNQIIAVTIWLLALMELRIEIILLIQHFTWTGLFFAFTNHKLAFLMLIIVPYYYGRLRRPLMSSDP